MGYFDDIVEVKRDMTQEANDMNRFAGNAFWFSFGALGMLITGTILCAFFHFELLYTGIPFLVSIAFSLVAIIYSLKAQRSASMIRQKNALKNVAMAYSILWMIFSIFILSINTYRSIMLILSFV